MGISLILAVSENGVTGRGNSLPWHLPSDLKRFRELTLNHTVIMGRKTFESIGNPLPGRRNVILSRNPEYQQAGAVVVNSLAEAMRLAEGDDEAFVIGGAQIHELALQHADRIYLTVVHADVEGDTFFLGFDPADWTLRDDKRHDADSDHEYAYSFQTFDRNN